MSQIFFCLLPGVNGYGSVCHEPFLITNISSRFFRRRGEGCHFRFRAPANHWLLPSSPPGQAILLGLLDVTQVRLLLIQTAVIPLPSSQWDITWQYIYIYIYIYMCVCVCIYIHINIHIHIHAHTYIYIPAHTHIYLRESLNKFPDFFCVGTFIDSTHMKL